MGAIVLFKRSLWPGGHQSLDLHPSLLRMLTCLLKNSYINYLQ